MKRILALALCVAGWIPLTIHGQDASESIPPPPVFTVVKINGIDGVATFTVVQPEELKALVKSVNDERQALPIAYSALRKEWRDKHRPPTPTQPILTVQEKKPKIPPFPLRKMPPLKELKKVGSFPTEEAATQHKQTLEERETERVAKLKARDEMLRTKMTMTMNLPAGYSMPNNPIATPNIVDEADSEERQEMLLALDAKITDIVATMQANATQMKDGSAGGQSSKLRRLGDDGTSPLVNNPTEFSRKKR